MIFAIVFYDSMQTPSLSLSLSLYIYIYLYVYVYIYIYIYIYIYGRPSQKFLTVVCLHHFRFLTFYNITVGYCLSLSLGTSLPSYHLVFYCILLKVCPSTARVLLYNIMRSKC